MVALSNREFLRRLKARLVKNAPEGLTIVNEIMRETKEDGYYCKLGELKGESLEVYFYAGLYFGTATIWVGVGAETSKGLANVRGRYDAGQIATLRNKDWNANLTLKEPARRDVQDHKFAYDDLRRNGNWKWFGRYLKLKENNVLPAVTFLVKLVTAPRREQPPWIGPTDRYALTKVRRAQTFFRNGQLEKWGRRCCVTGCCVKDILRASHIVGWAKSESSEHRTGRSNGLLLVSTLDALFDAKLISFNDDGMMLRSKEIERKAILGLRRGMRIRDGLSAEQRKYMRRHKNAFEKKEAAYLTRAAASHPPRR